MILDITEIKYFFIVLNLKEFEYLVFLFFFFFFLFLIFVSYKTFKSIESGVASNTESESFVLGLNNWHLCPFPQLIYQFRHSYSNFQSTINQKQYSNFKKKKKNKIPWLCYFKLIKCNFFFFKIRVLFLVYGAQEVGIWVSELMDKLWEWT